MLLCEQGSQAHFALAFNSQQTFLCVCVSHSATVCASIHVPVCEFVCLG